MKRSRNNAPSTAVIVSLLPNPNKVFCIPKQTSSTVVRIMIGMSLDLFSRVMATGLIRAVSPRMRKTLKILEPTTLPIAMSALPLRAPVRLTTSSGIEVPIPTIVIPMRNSLRPALRAIDEEPSTSHSAPRMTRASPQMRMRMSINIPVPA